MRVIKLLLSDITLFDAKHFLDTAASIAAALSADDLERFVGWPGAHGISGILHTLLLACDFYSPQELYPDADLMALIRQGTEALADITFPSGNLPSSLGNNSDR